MKLRILFLFIILTSVSCFAQEIECGTEVSSRLIELSLKDSDSYYYRKLRESDRLVTDTLFFPIQFHIVRRSNGTDGLSIDSLPKTINLLNYYYSSAKIQFYTCQDANFIDDDSLFISYNYRVQRDALEAMYNIPKVINIYFFPYLTNGYYSLAGVSVFPDDENTSIAIKNNYVTGATLLHEMGHYFNLFHTHETSFGKEMVRRINGNCETKGDKCCDTPADPNLNKSGMVSSDCIYIGDTVDMNGDLYEPDPTNFMCYCIFKNCRNHFTQMQYERVRDAAFHPNRYNIAHQQVFNNLVLNGNDTIIDEGSVRLLNIQMTNSNLYIHHCSETIIEKNFNMDILSTIQIQN